MPDQKHEPDMNKVCALIMDYFSVSKIVDYADAIRITGEHIGTVIDAFGMLEEQGLVVQAGWKKK